MTQRTILESVSANAGFLANCQVEFAPGLTCVIGARGTCKTTLVETIRFAFNSEPDRVRRLVGEGMSEGDPTFGLVSTTLGAGSVRCSVVTESAEGRTAQVLEREIGGDTRVYLDGVREHAARDVLNCIEIFSQSDLQRIADDGNDSLRLALIDRPHLSHVAKLRGERDQYAQKLLEIGPLLRNTRGQIVALRAELQPLAQLREQLEHARTSSPALSPELEAEKALYDRRQRVMGALVELEKTRQVITRQMSELPATLERALALTSSIRAEKGIDLTRVLGQLKEFESGLTELAAVRARIDRIPLRPTIETQGATFEHENARFYALRQEQQAINESLKQQQHLSRQVEQLERRTQELEAAVRQEGRLLVEREEARRAVARLDDELYTLRIREIDEINKAHRDNVSLTLRSGASSPRYSERLSGLLSGSRIRAQEEVAAALAAAFPPSALVDVVETGSGQAFADALGRDLGQMNRVVAHLSEHPDLYTLEAEVPDARLEITLFDNGQPKKVETLSKGQKATALLPLILRPLPYPLIIDQPEDDLDNSFIFGSLVKAIEALKGRRQLIFVTHNANIPVLGGADRVIVMKMLSPLLAAPPTTGTVDERKHDILDLLEGGAEAFSRREARYHELLPSRST